MSINVLSGRKNGRRANIDWTKVDLGKRPDHVIARELGLSGSAVGQARRARKIPSFASRRA